MLLLYASLASEHPSPSESRFKKSKLPSDSVSIGVTPVPADVGIPFEAVLSTLLSSSSAYPSLLASIPPDSTTS